LRLRLPFGRVLPVEESPILDIEAVPLARNHRCTAFKVVLEEISIIARPQRVGLLNTRPRVASTDSGLHPDGQAPVRRSSVTLSQMSSSSEDSLPVSSHNAWAYAQECSSAYDNAITRVRELSSASAKWPQGQFTTLGAYHGILANKVHLVIPPVTRDDTHTDVRNSHIQVHHQLVYELEYQVASSEMVDLLQKEPRVRAAAHIYNNLGSSNIVRRDEIRDDRRVGPTYTVRGTLPVAVVPAKIANMWGIRNTSRDPQTEPSAVVTAINEYAASFEPASAPFSSLSMPRLSMPDHDVRRMSTDSHLQSGASTPLAPYSQMPGGFASASVFDPSVRIRQWDLWRSRPILCRIRQGLVLRHIRQHLVLRHIHQGLVLRHIRQHLVLNSISHLVLLHIRQHLVLNSIRQHLALNSIRRNR
ncbi:hypothetical protein GGH20_004049, partial [Coemansia sp. RSA 1937]